MMIVIYISLLVLLALIIVFYYKFHQKNKDVDKQLKDLTEKLKKDNTELKEFQQFVINGFQHISKEIGLDKPNETEPPVPTEEEPDPMTVNNDLSNDLKEKINNLNTDPIVNNEPVYPGEDEPIRGEDAESGGGEDAGLREDAAESGGEDGAESGGEDGAESDGEEDHESDIEGGADNGGVDKSNISNLDLETLTLKELQTIARDNNLAIKGPKKNIIERIKNIN